MKLKDAIKKDFSNFDKIILKRFKSSKLIFIGMALLFYLNYFFLANFPDNEFLIFLLPIMYVGFITSLLLITYYSLKIKFSKKLNKNFSIALIVFLTIIGIVLSLPFIIKFN